MKTERFKASELKEASQKIQAGELVAFPTDTVYGLGADARSEAAVQKIFQAKNRPADRPLTILLADKKSIYSYAKKISPLAERLIDHFWPGPLTLVLEAKAGLAPSVTAGLKTVGMRMPAHPLALDFIRACGFPLATPSANLSGRPSPTTADHVLADLDGKIAGVIDGGATDLGIESTVLDLSQPKAPVILRPGGVSRQAIEEVIQRKVTAPLKNTFKDEKEGHYAPIVPIYMVKSNWPQALKKVKNKKFALLASEEVIQKYKKEAQASYSLGSKAEIKAAEKELFKGIRALEKADIELILAESYPENDATEAYLNRLEQAAKGKKI